MASFYLLPQLQDEDVSGGFPQGKDCHALHGHTRCALKKVVVLQDGFRSRGRRYGQLISSQSGSAQLVAYLSLAVIMITAIIAVSMLVNRGIEKGFKPLGTTFGSNLSRPIEPPSSVICGGLHREPEKPCEKVEQ